MARCGSVDEEAAAVFFWPSLMGGARQSVPNSSCSKRAPQEMTRSAASGSPVVWYWCRTCFSVK